MKTITPMPTTLVNMRDEAAKELAAIKDRTDERN